MLKIAVVLSMLVLTSCSQNAQSDSKKTDVKTSNVPADWKTYSRDNYSIKYPGSWSLKENQNVALFILFAPIDSAAPSFDANINLVIQDVKGKNIDLDKYTQISIDQVKANTSKDSILLNKKEQDSTGVYQHLIFSVEYQNTPLMWDQYYRVIDDKVYLLTLTTLPEQWNKSQKLGEQILSTFKVK